MINETSAHTAEEGVGVEQLTSAYETSLDRGPRSIKQELNEIRERAIAERKIFYGESGDFNYALAPNGERSNLNEKQWLEVRTQTFKEFFGEWEEDPANASKIVDDNGEPSVVYHGTTRTFDAFRHDASKTFELDNVQGAFYLASSREFVKKEYAQYKQTLIADMLRLFNNNFFDGQAQSWAPLVEKWNEFVIHIGTDRVSLQKRSTYPDGTPKQTTTVEFDGKTIIASDDLAPLWDRNLPDSFIPADYEYLDWQGSSLLAPKNTQQIIMALFVNIRRPIDRVINPEQLQSMDNVFHTGMYEVGLLPDGDGSFLPRSDHDGIIARDSQTGGFALAVFDGRQLKSATDNNGLFNSRSDNIYE